MFFKKANEFVFKWSIHFTMNLYFNFSRLIRGISKSRGIGRRVASPKLRDMGGVERPSISLPLHPKTPLPQC